MVLDQGEPSRPSRIEKGFPNPVIIGNTQTTITSAGQFKQFIEGLVTPCTVQFRRPQPLPPLRGCARVLSNPPIRPALNPDMEAVCRKKLDEPEYTGRVSKLYAWLKEEYPDRRAVAGNQNPLPAIPSMKHLERLVRKHYKEFKDAQAQGHDTMEHAPPNAESDVDATEEPLVHPALESHLPQPGLQILRRWDNGVWYSGYVVAGRRLRTQHGCRDYWEVLNLRAMNYQTQTS